MLFLWLSFEQKLIETNLLWDFFYYAFHVRSSHIAWHEFIRQSKMYANLRMAIWCLGLDNISSIFFFIFFYGIKKVYLPSSINSLYLCRKKSDDKWRVDAMQFAVFSSENMKEKHIFLDSWIWYLPFDGDDDIGLSQQQSFRIFDWTSFDPHRCLFLLS